MRILVAHNFYQLPGGEDRVFESEKMLLEDSGHQVVEYVRHNSDIIKGGPLDFATLPARAVWNWRSYSDLRRLIQDFRPQIAHFHNTLPLISPAAYSACWEAGVPVVQSVHNWRLMCPGGGLYYRNKYCQACVGKLLPWPGIARGCYRDSTVQTAVLGVATAAHHAVGTWSRRVSRYIVFSSFFREKFIQAGFPAARIAVKPHFLQDPGRGSRSLGYALFAGRLTREKGVATLLRAWQTLPGVRLVLCGSGVLESEARSLAATRPADISLRTFLPHPELLDVLKEAAFLVWPSETMETFGMIALEAMACGVPVISSGTGAASDLVVDGQTGIIFRAGDPEDLAAKVRWAEQHPAEMAAMGERARLKYLNRYTPERNVGELMDIYAAAIRQRSGNSGKT